MKQTFKQLFENKANPEIVYNKYNLPKEDRAVLDKVLKEGIGGGNQPIEINDGREYYFGTPSITDHIKTGTILTHKAIPYDLLQNGTESFNIRNGIDIYGNGSVVCVEVGDELGLDGISTKEAIKKYDRFSEFVPITKYNYFNLTDITQPVFIDLNEKSYVLHISSVIEEGSKSIRISNELYKRLTNANHISTFIRTIDSLDSEVIIEIVKYEKRNGLEYLIINQNATGETEYICNVEVPKPYELTYLRHTHYITNNATGGYYVEKNGEFELVEFNNATIEVKLDSDYSGNYKEGYVLFSVTFPGTDENGYVKNSRPYTYNEELGLITIEGVLQGTGSYSPLTEKKDINLKLTNGGRTLRLLNEHVISTTSPNVWTDGLVELQGVEI